MKLIYLISRFFFGLNFFKFSGPLWHNFIDTTSIHHIYKNNIHFQIHKDNKTETEEQIREALKSLMKPEEVEDELRKAIEGLNLEDSSAT